MKEKVLLAIVDFKLRDEWPLHQTVYEMAELVKACGGDVVETIFCPAHPPSASTLINKGKVQEIAELAQGLEVNTVILSAELKGHQQRNLEEAFGVKTLDRTNLILDIFARHATSQEGKLQVELAQLEYRLPRLAGHYDALSRPGGGIGTIGPGETKLEVDRRRIMQRIDRLRKELTDVTKSRGVKRKKRVGQHVPLVSIVGYTNAGKSTLLNTLTDAHQETKEGLFTTLDSLARQCVLPNKQKVVFSDTVGFMHDLPHNLIEAFKATLEEVQNADLLLHVLDVSSPNHLNHKTSVDKVLEELGVLKKPTVLVLNKIDKITDEEIVMAVRRKYENCVAISALGKQNIGALLFKVEEALAQLILTIDVRLPLNRMDLVHLAHKEGEVIAENYDEDGVHIYARLPEHLAGLFHQAAISIGE
jgi:GTP-binding protein HflX